MLMEKPSNIRDEQVKLVGGLRRQGRRASGEVCSVVVAIKGIHLFCSCCVATSTQGCQRLHTPNPLPLVFAPLLCPTPMPPSFAPLLYPSHCPIPSPLPPLPHPFAPLLCPTHFDYIRYPCLLRLLFTCVSHFSW